MLEVSDWAETSLTCSEALFLDFGLLEFELLSIVFCMAIDEVLFIGCLSVELSVTRSFDWSLLDVWSRQSWVRHKGDSIRSRSDKFALHALSCQFNLSLGSLAPILRRVPTLSECSDILTTFAILKVLIVDSREAARRLEGNFDSVTLSALVERLFF